jgi:hypothetical protein
MNKEGSVRSVEIGDTSGALEEALTHVLETMFFELPLDAVSKHSPEPGCIRASVKIAGSLRGRFHLAAELRLLGRLTQSFLGIDEGEAPGEDQQRSVICELANMLCGAALSRLMPDACLTLETGIENGPVACDAAWLACPLEQGRVFVKIELE